ncbi:MAG TPA: AAA domain-containing protein [Patescibacteria group bacterium]|nr:AAA domain-containing protein [Patescibacteria group bacterium]
MDPYQAIIAFWRDCIKSESALEQSFVVHTSKFSLASRVRTELFEGPQDPFIFAESDFTYTLQNGKTYDLVTRSKLKGQEVYFGYPMLMFTENKKNKIAPLFVMRLDVEVGESETVLARGESTPTLGANAFEKLGLKQEEIIALNTAVGEIFEANKKPKLETILYLLKKETQLTFVEGIDPQNLSTTDNIHPYSGTVIYNKAVLYASEASAYNLHILNDLEKLVKRTDLASSSLRYIGTPTANGYSDFTPVLPFQFDEYQLRAIQHILGSELTVVTGPPGTGKSQFIANLIINLFLLKKKVLFVSHTGEAVRVVNERINDNFANLMMQTGKKEIRQDLGRRLEEMVSQYNDQQTAPISDFSLRDITKNWHDIQEDANYVRHNNTMYRLLSRALQSQQNQKRRTGMLSWVAAFVVGIQVAALSQGIRKRRATHTVLETIEQAKQFHVEISRSYVEANYLSLILENGLYGQLLSYIDAVQNKKSNGYQSGRSDKYVSAALKAMNIWSCTLKSLAATFPLQADLFDYVIFDEASQIDLPSAAPALYRAHNMVVVGDENQLNHIAKINQKLEDELAEKYGLPGHDFYPALTRYSDVSLFNSAKKALTEPEQELKNHYRSNTLIANLFSDVFYGGKLRIYEPASKLPESMEPGVKWIDVKGAAYKYKSGSRYNRQEIAYIVKILERLLPIANQRDLTVGITTPYAKQRNLIADELAKKFEPEALNSVRVLTVHQFQGSEVDVLLFSPVLAQKGDGNSDYWYISNKQILNVAISRAKHLLLILGDLEYALHGQSKLKDIAEYCNALGQQEERPVPNRPMNIFEQKLLGILKKAVPKSYTIEPQYVTGNRFTLDFALISKKETIAVELDGRQHEIIGGIPVFEDKQRDAYLLAHGWFIIRITVYDLLQNPTRIAKLFEEIETRQARSFS